MFPWQRDGLPGVRELFSAPIDGSAAPQRISGPLPAGGFFVGEFRVAAAGGRVVYRAAQDTAGVYELYSVPISGGTIVKLNGPLVPGGDIFPLSYASNTAVSLGAAISPAGDRVVYQADQEVDDVFELFSVPITGGTAVKLTPGGQIGIFAISPAGDRVVYRADRELFSVPITGGAAVKLSGALTSGGQVAFFDISPAGDRVVYQADQQVDEVYELFSVPITGGAAVKLNGALTPGGEIHSFRFSPAGDRVVYHADQQVNDIYELYSVPVDGGTAAKLNGALTPGGDVGFFAFAISPVGDRVAYVADQDVDEVFELYSVPIAGGPVVKLNGPLVSDGDVSDFGFSPDGSWVVYRADQTFDEYWLLFRAPASGPAGNDQLLAELLTPSSSEFDPPPGENPGFRFTPKGDAVVLLSTHPFGTRSRPRRVRLLDPLDPAGNELVDESFFQPFGNATGFLIGPDDSIVYRADQDEDEVFDLYSIPSRIFSNGFE